MRRTKWLIVGVLAVVALGRPAAGQGFGGEPVYTGREWITEWYSWVHWWELNRGEMLSRRLEQAGPADAATKDAVAALMKAMGDDKPAELRGAAALALGRMRARAAVPRLIEMAGDDEAKVRRAACMALGLIGDDDAKAALFDVGRVRERDTVAWIVAVGLLEDPGGDALRALLKLVDQTRSPAVSRMAMWALRVHNPPGLARAARRVIARSKDPHLVSEAILALGRNPDADDHRLLADLYHDIGQANRTPAMMAAYEAYRPTPGIVQVTGGPLIVGIRTAPAIAMGHFEFPRDDRRGEVIRDVLRRSYERVPDGERTRPFRTDSCWSHGYVGSLERGGLELRFGLIALGRIGYEQEAELLIDSLQNQHAYLARHPSNPSRGFAAMGLGLYVHRTARVAPRPGDDVKRSDIRRTVRRSIDALARVAGDRGEPDNLRAACVLALGMSGDANAAKAIREVLKRGDPDTLITGYAVLALGMLHDRATLAVAAGALGETADDLDLDHLRGEGFGIDGEMPDLLARRAMVLGLGCLGDAAAIPTLRGQFSHDPYTAVEVIRALRRTGDGAIVSEMAALLDDPGRLDVALLAAWSLGALLGPDDYPRLHRALLLDCNLVFPLIVPPGDLAWWMESSPVHRYRCYTNEFLFKVMVPMLETPFRH